MGAATTLDDAEEEVTVMLSLRYKLSELAKQQFIGNTEDRNRQSYARMQATPDGELASR
jgi:hypothetical protein